MLGAGPVEEATHPLERFAAILAVAACVAITIIVWQSISRQQSMWPLPALYLIEMPAVSLMAGIAFVRGGRAGKSITWAGVGLLTAFCILGAWSIGFLYLPTTVLLGVLAVAYDVRGGQGVGMHLAVWLIAALAQGALMLAIIRVL